MGDDRQQGQGLEDTSPMLVDVSWSGRVAALPFVTAEPLSHIARPTVELPLVDPLARRMNNPGPECPGDVFWISVKTSP